MKKLFVCAMALAAFVSCSKDDVQGPALDSANKTVSITIENTTATRADGGVTAPGVADATGGTTMKSAKATELYVLFGKGDEIINALPLTAEGTTNETHDTNHSATYVADKANGTGEGTYIWHNVPWDVTKIAVVRTNATKDADYFATKAIGKNISDYAALAASETANLTRELSEIVLFGTGDLVDQKVTHEVDGISYHYWKAEVEVKPWVARFEINQIKCEDLGYLNTEAEGDIRTYGFDELIAKNLTWVTAGTVEEPAEGAKTYTAKKAEGATTLGIMYGLYNNTSAANNTKKEGTRDNFINAGANKVWSWNVEDGTTFDSMTVDLEAVAYDYTLTADGKNVPLYVVGLDGTTAAAYEFEAGHIYQLDLTFVEGNVKDQDQLCVQVVVSIANWTIETVNATFGQPANSTIPQN